MASDGTSQFASSNQTLASRPQMEFQFRDNRGRTTPGEHSRRACGAKASDLRFVYISTVV
jgi:hypothetical protein